MSTRILEAGGVGNTSASPGAILSRGVLATWLRWLGGGLVMLGAVTFLLQGFEDLTGVFRNWSVIGLMFSCSVGALLIERFFRDAKSARLLLGVAVALIPAQFAQLGSVLFELANPGREFAGPLDFVAGWSPALATPKALLWLMLSTVACGWFATRAGMRVLAGDAGREIGLVLLALSSLLLVPAREGFAGAVVIAALLLGYGLLLARIDMAQPRLRTFEGRAALLLPGLPVLIAATRFGLHADSLVALCFPVLLLSLTVIELIRRLSPTGRIAGLLVHFALTAFALAAFVQLVVFTDSWPEALAMTLSIAPIALYWLECSRWIVFGANLVRIGAAFMLFTLAFGLVQLQSVSAAVWLLGVSLACVAWGAVRAAKIPCIAGVSVALLAIIQCFWLALSGVELNSWLLLALGGVGLVVTASAVERYGSQLVSRGRTVWVKVAGWS